MRDLGHADVFIAGGGLAGLCLALQLRQTVPGLGVVVAEKSTRPAPHAAHKVGESSVEISAHYFDSVLGLSDLLRNELPKFGLRFFLSEGSNLEIERRLECGPSHFMTVPSYQIDRGQFENALGERAEGVGVHLYDECRVRGVGLGAAGADHSIRLELAGEPCTMRSRWVIDATGRASVLKKQLELARPNRHNVNAAWFRVDAALDVDEWSDDLAWRGRCKEPRRLSTNHLMGEGYWVWLIPLAAGRTSVGIVAADDLHAFTEISSFERALEWLGRHEPRCAEEVAAAGDRLMDFRALRNYSHDVRRMFSAERWCLVGDAGLFTDPLYSPGSDFIGIANGFISDLIRRDFEGDDVAAVAAIYDQTYRSMGRTYLTNYHRQYPLMGSPRVMCSKIIWDFTMYWGGVALIFFADRLCDAEVMSQAQATLRRFAAMNVRIQALFRDWIQPAAASPTPAGRFVDYAELGFLADLNRQLLEEIDDAGLLARLERNAALSSELFAEICAEASLDMPGRDELSHATPTTDHLGSVFAQLR